MADENPISPVKPAATPGAPRPITIRLKPVTHKPIAPVPSAAAPSPITPLKPIAAAPAVPANAEPPKAAADHPSPIAPISPIAPLAPVGGGTKSGTQTIVMQPVAPAKAVSPTQAQIQASKSKTSRITLDSAIGVAASVPVPPAEGPKTIRLKRPTDFAPHPAVTIPAPTAEKNGTAPMRSTSRIPDEVIDAAAEQPSQKKTLKIKRPSQPPLTPLAPSPASGTAAASAPTAGAPAPVGLDGVTLTPIANLEPAAAPEGTASKIFTSIAVIAAAASLVVGILLVWCLMASGMGPKAGPNSPASISGPELPWAGKLN